VHTGVSRRHEHLYFAAETLAPVSAGFQLHGPRVNSRESIVPDNHNKFAIAVTRARVDSPSFLFLIPPVCESFASVGGEPFAPIFTAKLPHVGKALQNPAVTVPRTCLLRTKCTPFK
jgi:hypothetical protein